LILLPTGTAFIAITLGHAAVRRRATVRFERAYRPLKRLKAARLDNSHDTEMRKLLRTDLLILDLCRRWNYADDSRAALQAACGPGAQRTEIRQRSPGKGHTRKAPLWAA